MTKRPFKEFVKIWECGRIWKNDTNNQKIYFTSKDGTYYSTLKRLRNCVQTGTFTLSRRTAKASLYYFPEKWKK
ncbi:ORF64 [White spot syndrome virus]|uniref:ORF64 n=1 Tax=White spot syndrome virus TaxID=342409 RepID=A0A2D3I6D1_9VIRU|nr:ORF64 [White spot syndrome virus]